DQPPPRTGFGAWHLAYDEPVGPVRPLRDHGSHLRHREHASSVGTPRIIPLPNASTKRRSAHDPATPYGGERASPRRALLVRHRDRALDRFIAKSSHHGERPHVGRTWVSASGNRSRAAAVPTACPFDIRPGPIPSAHGSLSYDGTALGAHWTTSNVCPD